MSRSPLYLPSDQKKWRTLISCARRAAADVNYSRPLHAAGKDALKATFPDQSTEGREPFRKLVAMSAMWPQLTKPHRRERAAKLAELARQCAVIMGDDTPDDPEPEQAALPLWTTRTDCGG